MAQPRKKEILTWESATCADCGTLLKRGDEVKIYGANVYGTQCHKLLVPVRKGWRKRNDPRIGRT